MKTSSGGRLGNEARKNSYRDVIAERNKLIRSAFDLAYATKVFSYKEARTLTPYELRVIAERYSEIIEERNKEYDKINKK